MTWPCQQDSITRLEVGGRGFLFGDDKTSRKTCYSPSLMLLLIIYSRNSSEFLQVKAKQRLSSEVTNWSLQKQIETQREGEKMLYYYYSCRLRFILADRSVFWSPATIVFSPVVSDLHFIKFTTGRQEIFFCGKNFEICRMQGSGCKEH